MIASIGGDVPGKGRDGCWMVCTADDGGFAGPEILCSDFEIGDV